MTSQSVHIPILLETIVNALTEPCVNLELKDPHYIVDCTFGGGGHTRALLNFLSQNSKISHHRVMAFDRDAEAIERGKQKFKQEISENKLTLIQSRFSQAEKFIQDVPVVGFLADLGFSSDQMDNAERGFSFRYDSPLDMRLDPSCGKTCYEYLAEASEIEIEQVLRDYGEERFSKRIARSIEYHKRQGKLPSTTQALSKLIVQAIPPAARHKKIHAATKSFQAFRIVVNQELEELDCLLERVILSLRQGGRAAVMSFHSLEDRKVKVAFRALSKNTASESQFRLVSKKAIKPERKEMLNNPRSRSAKLRIIEKI